VSAEQFFKSLAVKAEDHLAINDDDWGCHCPDLFQLLNRCGFFRNVSFFITDAALRKKLLRFAAEQSARLAVNDYLHKHTTSGLSPSSS
jgi:hypothetical protein